MGVVAEGVIGTRVVTVNEVVSGHVALDIECLDRIYLNACVQILQSSGQVVAFMTQYLDLSTRPSTCGNCPHLHELHDFRGHVGDPAHDHR
jgi:hypothetical protein